MKHKYVSTEAQLILKSTAGCYQKENLHLYSWEA